MFRQDHFKENVFDEKRLTFRILLMYYVLLYEELVLLNIRAIGNCYFRKCSFLLFIEDLFSNHWS